MTLYGLAGRSVEQLVAQERPDRGAVRDVVLAPDRTWGATVGDGADVRLWRVNPQTGIWTPRESLPGHGGDVGEAEVDAVHHRLITIALGDRVIVWDARLDDGSAAASRATTGGDLLRAACEVAGPRPEPGGVAAGTSPGDRGGPPVPTSTRTQPPPDGRWGGHRMEWRGGRPVAARRTGDRGHSSGGAPGPTKLDFRRADPLPVLAARQPRRGVGARSSSTCETRELTAGAIEILEEIRPEGAEEHPKAKHELLQSTVEIITGICTTVAEAKADLAGTLAEVVAAADAARPGRDVRGHPPVHRLADPADLAEGALPAAGRARCSGWPGGCRSSASTCTSASGRRRRRSRSSTRSASTCRTSWRCRRPRRSGSAATPGWRRRGPRSSRACRPPGCPTSSRAGTSSRSTWRR